MKLFTLDFNDERMNERLIAWHAGIIGGITQWANNMYLTLGTISTMVEGMVTAVCCGFAGLLGKELFVITKKAVKEYFKRRKINKLNKNKHESE